MPESFDPYHVWLGIPPEDQPPKHYLVLWIRPFESNADVIDNMADQRMTHLRTFQTGKNGKLSQKLLNEVAAARLCLLGKQSKQDYDRKLRGVVASSPSGVALAAQTGSPPLSPSGIATSASPPSVPNSPVSRESLRRAPAAVATTVPAQPVHKSQAR